MIFTRLLLILIGFWLIGRVWRFIGAARRREVDARATGRETRRSRFGKETIVDAEFEEIKEQQDESR